MYLAPFLWIGFVSAYRISVLRKLRNCAFQTCLSVQCRNGTGDFRKTHLSDVAGGYAQGVQGLRRAKVCDTPEIIIREIDRRVYTAADKEHITYAVSDSVSEGDFQIEVVQFLQKAVLLAIFQLRQIIRKAILHGVFCCGEQGFRKAAFIFQLSKAVFQRLRDLRFVLRADLPERDPPCKPPRMGVGDVKVVFQSCPSGRVPVKDRDPGRAPVDPAPKLPVPSLDLQDSGGVRALGEKQELLVKGQLIVPAGCGKEPLPLLRSCDFRLYAMIQLRDQLISSCHRLRLLIFACLLAAAAGRWGIHRP